MGKIILKAFVSALLVLAASQAWADGHGVNCPRFAPGSVVLPPPDIYSQNGAINVQLNYFTTVDQDGRSLFCFQTPDGLEGPTLRLNPGDQLNILAANDVPPGTAVSHPMEGLDGARVTSPMDGFGWSSKSACQVTPPLTDLKSPPAAAPT